MNSSVFRLSFFPQRSCYIEYEGIEAVCGQQELDAGKPPTIEAFGDPTWRDLEGEALEDLFPKVIMTTK